METLTPEQERLLDYLDKILLELRQNLQDKTVPQYQRDLLAARRDSILAEYNLI